MKGLRRNLGRLLALGLLSFMALQAGLALRVGLMAGVDPQSTAFERSEAWRLLRTHGRIDWSQDWVPYGAISPHLKRAVIASEDAGFSDHAGIEWDAVERAWERNRQAELRAERRQAARPQQPVAVKLVGGSTITQQLAKNLLLSGERTVWRKAQEAVLALWLEAFLSKQRILEIYLNHVEWGEGVFGAQAAARHYHHVDASRIAPLQAARLAVMLPAPKRFEQRPESAYVAGRAATIVARMGAVALP
ncbi:MAG: monofunctional biosynthetic peptidoglycan transglycosylase [Rubrivivax sp.]|nr:monofunctional biosynthetic peptidoglycan transglycosylase [Rubrivivax sp.]